MHIINIGYPKTGTTWTWKNLVKQSWFTCTIHNGNLDFVPPYMKENSTLIKGTTSVEQYALDYSLNNTSIISANFYPWMFTADRYIIKKLSCYDIKVSIILRNPFELLFSLYNFIELKNGNLTGKSYSEYAENLVVNTSWFLNTPVILERWSEYFGDERFKIFYYDDLVADQKKFLENYSSEIDLPDFQDIIYSKINETNYIENIVPLNKNLTEKINRNIFSLEQYLNKSLDNWKD